MLVATYSPAALQNGKGVITGGMLTSNVETEKGLLTLITTDAPGIQVYVSCIISVIKLLLVSLIEHRLKLSMIGL